MSNHCCGIETAAELPTAQSTHQCAAHVAIVKLLTKRNAPAPIETQKTPPKYWPVI
jgi:hypothetical protein